MANSPYDSRLLHSTAYGIKQACPTKINAVVGLIRLLDAQFQLVPILLFARQILLFAVLLVFLVALPARLD